MKQESSRGNELRLQREEMGLSREDVFRMLRIPLDVIDKIESGELEPRPSMTYSIGFIKSYCDLLGLSPEPYIADIILAHREPKGLLNQAIHAKPKDQPPWLRETIMWVTVLAIMVLGWITYSVIFQPNAPDEPGGVQADTIDIRVPQFPMR